MQVSCRGFTALLKVMSALSQTVQFRLKASSPLYFAPTINFNLVVKMLQMANLLS